MRVAGISALCLASALLGCASDLDGSPTPTPTSYELIDDMDHAGAGDPTPPEGSAAFFWHSPSTLGLGNWFVSWSDGLTWDAQIDAIDPPRDASQKACHVTSSDIGRGANLWAQLDHPEGRAVDMSGYAGITFWARLTGAGGTLAVAVNGGQGYFPARASGAPLPSQDLAVSPQWQQFTVRFDGFASWPTAVVSFDFAVAGGAEPFDLWIDDLALVCRAACP